jgi:membrane fusion protein, multidrug efflux system
MPIRHRTRRLATLGIAGSAVLLLVGCGGQHVGPPSMDFRPQVSVVTLHSQPVTLSRELPGRTSAYLVADVRPQRRLFTEGSLVHAGQPLYQIDDSLYRAQYDSAKAALQKAQATAVAAELARKRSAELVKIDAVSAQDNENAISAAAQAEAEVAAARAALDSAAVNLAYARITAPITGRIGRSSVTEGALVTADQATALATIQELDPIYIDVNQSSADWLQLNQEIESGRIKSQGAGTPATILLEDGTVYRHKGRVQFSDVSVDPTTGNFLLRVLVPNPEGLLLPGMYVRAVIDEGVLPHGILVPQEGIAHDPRGNASALIVDAAGKVEQRHVDITRAVGDQWLVDDGLKAGDRLIVAGGQKVQPGMAVQAVEASAPNGGAYPDSAGAGGASAAHSSPGPATASPASASPASAGPGGAGPAGAPSSAQSSGAAGTAAPPAG